MKERDNRCPKCGCKLLCRDGDYIFCLAFNCSWRVLAKRKLDKELPTKADLRKVWE